jgi:hypothetical protein
MCIGWSLTKYLVFFCVDQKSKTGCHRSVLIQDLVGKWKKYLSKILETILNRNVTLVVIRLFFINRKSKLADITGYCLTIAIWMQIVFSKINYILVWSQTVHEPYERCRAKVSLLSSFNILNFFTCRIRL